MHKYTKRRAIILTLSVALAYYAICFALEITCPILALFGFPCPTCGVTRALLSLIFLKPLDYFRYNAMAIPLVFALFLALFEHRLRNRKAVIAAVFAILLINTVYYSIRLIYYF